MAYLVILLSLCATTIASGNSQYRLSHIGFMGTRGKRSIDENSGHDSTTISSQNMQSLSPNVEFNENDFRNYLEYLQYPELSVFKRAPVGFMGMRGKKDFEYSDFSSQSIDNLTPKGRRVPLSAFNRIIMNPNPKRAPSGFMGMRGKKLENFVDNKRVPLGFFGTRGKKDLYDFGLFDNEFKNWNELESNNPLYEAEGDDSNLILQADGSGDFFKRAPNSGFFGVRGKKLYDDEEDIGKRAPTGFLGMRGKRFNSPEESFNDMEKRKLNGFFGVRGKKDVSSQLEEDKRSSLAQFFGIRGKKQPINSGFFGMRGKKEPFQFRGKFVGVRGKKSGEESDKGLEIKLYDSPSSISSVDPINLSDDIISKRGPSGFVGMRGKKFSSSEEAANAN